VRINHRGVTGWEAVELQRLWNGFLAWEKQGTLSTLRWVDKTIRKYYQIWRLVGTLRKRTMCLNTWGTSGVAVVCHVGNQTRHHLVWGEYYVKKIESAVYKLWYTRVFEFRELLR
jgi:hypothetical protein